MLYERDSRTLCRGDSRLNPKRRSFTERVPGSLNSLGTDIPTRCHPATARDAMADTSPRRVRCSGQTHTRGGPGRHTSDISARGITGSAPKPWAKTAPDAKPAAIGIAASAKRRPPKLRARSTTAVRPNPTATTTEAARACGAISAETSQHTYQPVRCRIHSGSCASGRTIQPYPTRRTEGTAMTGGARVPTAKPTSACATMTATATPRIRASGVAASTLPSNRMTARATLASPATRIGASDHPTRDAVVRTCGKSSHPARRRRPPSHAANAAHAGPSMNTVDAPAVTNAEG